MVWLCSVAPLAAILIPLLLPLLQQTHGLGGAQIGLLASADLAGACIATVTAPFWLARVGCRVGAATGLLTLIAANGLAAFTTTSPSLLVARLVAGIGTGIVLSSSIPVVSASARPARLVSAIQVLQLLLAAVALIGAGRLLPAGGVRLVLLAVVAVSAASVPMAFLLPRRTAAPDHNMPTLAEMLPGGPVLFAILIYFASLAIFTNYAGKLGVQHGLSIAAVSSALAAANLGALPGSLIAMMTNRANRRRMLLIAAAIIQCLAVGLMLWAYGPGLFGSAFFAIQMCITIIAPLQVAALVDRDLSGRAIEGLAAVQSVGQAAGPLLGAIFISGADVGGAYFFGVGCIIVSAAIIARRTNGAISRPLRPI